MGSSRWSPQSYSDRQSYRQTTGQSAFVHHAAQQALPASQRKIHANADPKGLKIRESRDSKDHPTSRAVAVFFDQTGSMGEIPKVLQKKLGQLMGFLLHKGHLEHPQIMFGAIGDARPRGNEIAPLQIGQYESGLEMDDDLGKLYLEGNGGGQMRESYDLALYALARHTALDCFEKRGDKGFAFVIGDEMPYDFVERSIVKDIIGDDLEADIPIATIVKEVEKTYHLFFIRISSSSYPNASYPQIEKAWRKLLGERVLLLEDPDAVCEMIATTIALVEGAELSQAVSDLVAVGVDSSLASAVGNALVPFAKSGSLAKPAVAVDDLPTIAGGRRGKRLA